MVGVCVRHTGVARLDARLSIKGARQPALPLVHAANAFGHCQRVALR